MLKIDISDETLRAEAAGLENQLKEAYRKEEGWTGPDGLSNGLVLRMEKEGLSLTDGTLSIRGDFSALLRRIHPGNLSKELLVRCAKIRNSIGPVPCVLDATAGMGEDSFLLAAAGYEVLLYEADPVIGALLADAIRRARENEQTRDAAQRMTFHAGDSISALPLWKNRVDVVYLDPMFPERQKSALVKKKFQLLQQLERPCSDQEALLEAALSAKPKKIVIKRPLKGPFLAGVRPDYSLEGKAIRYDCLVRGS